MKLIEIPNVGFRIVKNNTNTSLCKICYQGTRKECENIREKLMWGYWFEKSRELYIKEKSSQTIKSKEL